MYGDDSVGHATQSRTNHGCGPCFLGHLTGQEQREGGEEQEVWDAKDMLFAQIEQATRKIVCRNWPSWLTEENRRLDGM